jgi:hypothetical protein
MSLLCARMNENTTPPEHAQQQQQQQQAPGQAVIESELLQQERKLARGAGSLLIEIKWAILEESSFYVHFL